MNNFKNMLDEAILDSDRIAIGSVMRNIDDYKKGKMDAEDFSKIISAYRQELKDATISIAKAEKK